MNKSSIIFGIGGLLAGSLGTSLYYRSTSPAPTPVAAVPVAPKDEKKVVAKETTPKVEGVEHTTGKPTAAKKQASVATTLDSAKMAEVKKRMSDQANQRKILRVNEQLAGLKNQLGLTDEQSEELRPLISRMMATGRGLDIGELMSGGGIMKLDPDKMKEKAAEMAKDKNAAENELIAKLTPEQNLAYDQWKLAEKANQVELAANRELSSLQSQMSLTADQKDRAFAALSALAQNEVQVDPMAEPVKFMERRKDRIEALKPILTPEQMALYERNAASMVTIQSGGVVIDGGAIDPGGAINTQVISAPEISITTTP
jgi:hypothetical protein